MQKLHRTFLLYENILKALIFVLSNADKKFIRVKYFDYKIIRRLVYLISYKLNN